MMEKIAASEDDKLSGGWRLVTLDVLFLLMCIDAVRLLNHEPFAEALGSEPTFMGAFIAVLFASLITGFLYLIIPSVFRIGKKKSSGILASWLCAIPAIGLFLISVITPGEGMLFSLCTIWFLAAAFKLVRCASLREFMPLWSVSMVAEGGCSVLMVVWMAVQFIVGIILPFWLLYRFIKWLL